MRHARNYSITFTSLIHKIYSNNREYSEYVGRNTFQVILKTSLSTQSIVLVCTDNLTRTTEEAEYKHRMKKRSEVTQTLCTGCSKADPQTNTQTGAITIHCAA